MYAHLADEGYNWADGLLRTLTAEPPQLRYVAYYE